MDRLSQMVRPLIKRGLRGLDETSRRGDGVGRQASILDPKRFGREMLVRASPCG